MKYRTALVAAIAVVCGCIGTTAVTDAPPLNSERIEARYGSYGVSILRQSGERRDTCLFSEDAGARTCRTLAIVVFEGDSAEDLSAPLGKIRDGASLGATLEAAGWSVRKVNRHIGSLSVSAADGAVLAGHFRIQMPATLGLHIYDLQAVRGDISHPVARLLELHHPDYLSAAELERIYADLTDEPLTAAAIDEWRSRIASIPPAARRFN